MSFFGPPMGANEVGLTEPLSPFREGEDFERAGPGEPVRSIASAALLPVDRIDEVDGELSIAAVGQR